MEIKLHSIDNPITSQPLADKVGLSNASMRKLAARLTCEGFPIGSDMERGYYWARTPVEMSPKIHHLQSRIVGIARHLKGAKEVQRLLGGGSPRSSAQMDLEFYSETGATH